MAGIFLEAGQTGYKVVNTGDEVFGSTGTETVAIDSSANSIEVDANAEQVNFAGAITDYKFAQAGNILKVYASNGTTLVAKVVTDGSSLVKFASVDAVDLLITSGTMSIDGNDITSSVAALGATVTTASELTNVIAGSLTAVTIADSLTVDSSDSLAQFTAGIKIDDSKILTATAAQVSGLAIDETSGSATVAVTALNATADADLHLITTNSVTAAVADDVTFTGKLGTAVTTVASGKTLTADVAVVQGKTIDGDGTVAVTALNTDADADLSTITAHSVTAAVADDVTFTGNLGTAVVTVADAKTLTAAAEIAGTNVIADGTDAANVVITTIAATTDLSNIDVAGTTTATVTTDVELTNGTANLKKGCQALFYAFS